MSESDIWNKFDEFLSRYRFQIGSLLLGFILIGAGLTMVRGKNVQSPEVKSSQTAVPETQVEETPSNININTADQATLETLPGIGPTKAKAIVDFRDKNGPFKNTDDILDVPGIGPKTLDGIREQIEVK